MIDRRIAPLVAEALADTRVVMVMGARQVGKSTLCESIAATDGRHTVSLDDRAPRENAAADPAGFLAGFDGPVFIDEVQRVPELILAIKRSVDREQQPGRFLLSGSANVLGSRKVQEALTGRIELLQLEYQCSRRRPCRERASGPSSREAANSASTRFPRPS